MNSTASRNCSKHAPTRELYVTTCLDPVEKQSPGIIVGYVILIVGTATQAALHHWFHPALPAAGAIGATGGAMQLTLKSNRQYNAFNAVAKHGITEIPWTLGQILAVCMFMPFYWQMIVALKVN